QNRFVRIAQDLSTQEALVLSVHGRQHRFDAAAKVIRIRLHSATGAHDPDRGDVQDAPHAFGRQRARFGLDDGTDPDLQTPAKRFVQRVGDRILSDIALAVLLGTKIADVGRDGAADQPIHHHVFVFGIDPDVYAFDIGDVAGFVAYGLTRAALHCVLDG